METMTSRQVGDQRPQSSAEEAWARDFWAGDCDHPLLTVEDLVAFASESADLQALARVEHGLTMLPLPAGVAEALMSVLRCATAQAQSADGLIAAPEAITNGQLLDGAQAAAGVRGFVDGVVVGAARALADRAGHELLGRKNVTDPDDLPRNEREQWVKKTKSVVAQQLAVLTGDGVMSSHTRVGFALAPRAAVQVADAALCRGATEWRSVADFWASCRRMPYHQAGDVAEAVFGPLVAGAAPEDTPEGGDSGRRETRAEFRRRLDREVRRVEGEDAKAARERRKAAVAMRDVRAEVCDDGVGQITITGPTTSIVAGIDRIESIARKARKAGDERSLGHLRADTAMALLVHGVLPLPDSGSDGCGDGCGHVCSDGSAEGPRPDHPGQGPAKRSSGQGPAKDICGWGPATQSSAQLVPTPDDVRRIISGQPPATVELVMPLDALGVFPAGDRHRCPCDDQSPCHRGPSHDGCLCRGPAPAAPGAGVAEIPGHGFVNAEHAREIVLAPGTTLHRLLMDPADGRVVERSIAAYRPDADMVRQVRAADRFCRAPGCLVPAHRCELDHESPFGIGGKTSEVNLNLKHPRHHQLKTERFWSSVMDSTRDITWTTLFGRVYRTRSHDYRQYGGRGVTPAAAEPGITPAGEPGMELGMDPAAELAMDPVGALGMDPATFDDSDLRDRLVYAALSSREGQNRWLEALDDYDSGAWTIGYGRPVAVFHRRGGGRRHGPPPGQPTPEEILREVAADVGAGTQTTDARRGSELGNGVASGHGVPSGTGVPSGRGNATKSGRGTGPWTSNTSRWPEQPPF